MSIPKRPFVQVIFYVILAVSLSRVETISGASLHPFLLVFHSPLKVKGVLLIFFFE